VRVSADLLSWPHRSLNLPAPDRFTEYTRIFLRSKIIAAFFVSPPEFYHYNDWFEIKVLYNKDTKREEHKTKTKLLKLEVKISKLPIKRLVQK